MVGPTAKLNGLGALSNSGAVSSTTQGPSKAYVNATDWLMKLGFHLAGRRQQILCSVNPQLCGSDVPRPELADLVTLRQAGELVHQDIGHERLHSTEDRNAIEGIKHGRPGAK